ncbi:hypothetical protein [Argonema galeatum]|uniref:hypothetical protein n=1 Tax=Argonema galeatum TaxID=2942762 RepID=UPI0020118AA7|nr:hypothetical protein [Argonema galeatum]MCL1466097.1 hypothetical protein [Argonema galeatum A003/A1]
MRTRVRAVGNRVWEWMSVRTRVRAVGNRACGDGSANASACRRQSGLGMDVGAFALRAVGNRACRIRECDRAYDRLVW